MRQLILALCTIWAVTFSASAQPPANVVLDEARMQEVERMRRVTGELRAYQRSQLAAREEGLVLELAVRAGDEVTRGQTIARLDPVLAELTVKTSRANVDALRAIVNEREAERDRAQLDVERYESLVDAASATSQEIEDARVDLASAEARLRSAEAQVAAAEASLALDEQRLRDMEIRAPFDGRVVRTATEVGQWVGVGDIVAEIYSADSIEAWVDVPESAAERMAGVGSTVSVQIPAIAGVSGGEVNGTVTQIVPDVDPLSRLFPVRISVPNDSGLLTPGMSATAMIPTGDRTQMLTISKDAILRDDAGEFVYIAVPNETPGSPFEEMAIPMRISREFAVGDRVTIRQGAIEPGARLIVEGNERMFPTQPIVDVSDTASREIRNAAPVPVQESAEGPAMTTENQGG